MSDTAVTLADKEAALLIEYAKMTGQSLDEALKSAFDRGVKERLQQDKKGTVEVLKRP